MGIEYRNANRCCGYLDIIIAEDFMSLVDHLHLFFRVAVVKEHINMGQTVPRDRMGIGFTFIVAFQPFG